MVNLLKNLYSVLEWMFFEIFPKLADVSMGILGEFLDAIGYAKAILGAIIFVVVLAVKITLSKLSDR